MGNTRERRPNGSNAPNPRMNANFLHQLVPIRSVDIGDRNGATSLRLALNNRAQPLFLVECMLELICSLYEPSSTDRRKQLYIMLRNLFTEKSLLPPVSTIPGLEGVRNRFQVHLTNIFLQARRELFATPASEQLSVVPRPLNFQGEAAYSRYENDFEELEFIAGGGFGLVYKARNKLDNAIYAVKKILFKSNKAQKILREVQLISQLHHPNIVAYKNAWLDACPPHMMREYMSRMEESFRSVSSCRSTSVSREVTTRRVETSSSDSSSIVFESETVKSAVHVSRSETVVRSVVAANYWNRQYRTPVPRYVLYIQMQLCHLTLRQWLQQRQQLTDIGVELQILRQILEGVAYIHSNGIVHRDLKPENIFFNESDGRVQIADFGLARLLESEADGSAVLMPQGMVDVPRAPTGRVGTLSYAAPEQLNGTDCNAKSDMYSIGVLLLELLHPFSTEMERHQLIRDLRTNHTVPDCIQNNWPHLGNLIAALTAADPQDRPTAQGALDLLEPQSKSVAELEDLVKQKDEEISRLRRLLEEKDVLIAQLTKK